MDERIDLKKFFRIIRKRIVTIIVTVICVSLITMGISLFILKPTYDATAGIIIGKLTKDDGNYSDTQALSTLLATTMDLIKSPIVLNSVQKELDMNDKDLEKLEEQIVVQNNRNSQIVNVVVRDHDENEAKKRADIIANTSVNKMREQLNVQDISLVNGDPSIKRVGSLTLNVAIGIVIGIFLGVALAMFREYWDDSIKDVKEIDGIGGLPILGEVKLKSIKRKSINKSKGRKQQATILTENKRGEISV
ncbi:YveK family protein [Neobacillus bataviensis]|uniref:YveK family protein n=1 Tax=Neobacillus bataviensis TaxID=220685 RepID=UPI001CC133E7|nr:Wzz/FepE/Etk N-terminal domain-containing protein [Neobacillus bataviensis]